MRVEEEISTKATVTIERIKDVVGEVMSSCRNLQFELLESIMSRVVFAKKTLRESFLQEALNSAGDAGYRVALQHYINQNNFRIYRAHEDDDADWAKDSDRSSDYAEDDMERYEKRKAAESQRIIEYSSVDISNALALDGDWARRL